MEDDAENRGVTSSSPIVERETIEDVRDGVHEAPWINNNMLLSVHRIFDEE